MYPREPRPITVDCRYEVETYPKVPRPVKEEGVTVSAETYPKVPRPSRVELI
jgi:hypothetical protein